MNDIDQAVAAMGTQPIRLSLFRRIIQHIKRYLNLTSWSEVKYEETDI